MLPCSQQPGGRGSHHVSLMEEWTQRLWCAHTHVHMQTHVHTHMHTYTHIHTHTGTRLSHNNQEILPFATTWMDPEGFLRSETQQTEKDKDHGTSSTCGI